MMTLAQASSYFDRTQAFDAYSGEPLFLAQVDPYDDSKRDAMVAYRRILSVAPGVTIPAHRAIRLFDAVWLVAGEAEVDGLAEAHRVKYVLQMADGQLNIGTISDYLSETPSSTLYGFAGWAKDVKQIEESSDVANTFEILLPGDAEVRPQQILWKDGVAYIAESVRRLPSDYIGVNAVRLDSSEPALAIVQTRVYKPAAGAYELGERNEVLALRIRWQSLFRYDAQMAARYQEGDFTLALLEGPEVDMSSRITIDDVAHSVLSVTKVEGAIVAHVRRA